MTAASLTLNTDAVAPRDRAPQWREPALHTEAKYIHMGTTANADRRDHTAPRRAIRATVDLTPDNDREVWQAVRDMMQWPVDESCKAVCRLRYGPSAPEGSTPWQAFAEDGTALDWRSAVEWWRSVQTPAARTAVAIQDARAMSARISMDSKQLMDEATQDTFVWMLNQIDPDVAYHYWTRIGMIAKDLGMENEWIRWCSNGAKYSAGEPQRKLASFRR